MVLHSDFVLRMYVEDTQQMMSGMPGYMPPEVPKEVQQAQAGTGEYVMVNNERR